MRRTPTAPFAGATLIAGYAVAVGSGSRPLGGVVLLIGGGSCAWVWERRHGARTALALTAVGFSAFVASHLLALALGAWPSVLLVAAATAAAAWRWADSRPPRERATASAPSERPPARLGAAPLPGHTLD